MLKQKKYNMKILKSFTIVLLLTANITVFGQTTSDNEKEKPYIEVTGTAEKEIIPDEIYISITIRERQEGKEKITIDKQEENLKESLKSIGISLDNLFLSDANANYISVKWMKKDVITKNEYILKVGDALTVGRVFEKLDDVKINDAYISRVSHSKLDEFKKDVRIMAIKAAKEKADYLLSAIGEQTGKALKVYEQSPSYKINDSNLNFISGRSVNSSLLEDGVIMNESDKIIQFQKIKLQAAIYVKFEIK
jgi:uncharacterized protein